ncbi:conserved hypothetical protein [Clostridium botulinum NCTC 2916]|nr:amidase domain-containing protein [Clostridium botulinum]EDT79956.1 conserved hypothetical protein [Clostridium botulinum NCTC 2916]
MLFLCLTLIVCGLFTNSRVFANESIKSINDLPQTDLPQTDLIKINNSIDKVLSSDFEIMKTWKFTSCKDVIKDPKLLQLIDKSNKFNVEWYKKGDLKINNYTSKLNIVDLIKESNNKYIANVTHDVKFKVIGNDFLSESTGKRYRIELMCENNKWYITKLLDLATDLDTDNVNPIENEKNSITRSSRSLNKNNQFPNYDNMINSKILSISEASNNIDEYAEKLKVNLSSNSNEMPISRAYSGYNSSGAVAYAHKWATSFNPKYMRFSADCTNFVSQCAFEGGRIPNHNISPVWIPALQEKGAPKYSKSWTCVKDFYNFMLQAGYASAPEGGCKQARLGDVLQLYNVPKNDWTHAMIVTKIDSKGRVYYSAHTDPKLDVPVWYALDGKTYGNIRLIKFWH